MSNTNTNLRTQTSNALHNAIMEAGSKDHPPMLASGSSETTTEGYMENYKNVSQHIRDQLNAEAEAVQIILIWIDNDIYSTVDACLNACEMLKAIERLKQAIKRLKQGESINVQDHETNFYWEFRKFTSRDGESRESYYSRFYKMMNKLGQELKIVSYLKLYDILKQHQNEVNEIRAERLARTANPLALVAQQQPVNHPQNHPTHYTQNSSTRSQQVATRNRGGDKLVRWSSKKQECTSMSSAEAKYVSLSACCAQVLWLKTQLTDYGFYIDKIPMYCDSKAAISISCNPV
nr:uncharacterized mitochondrial protein AtMg00810-like [Tanacetum cinerariifolium]